MTDKIEVESVLRPGRRKVDRAKYEAMREAMLAAAPGEGPGLTASELAEAVKPRLPDALFPGGAKAGWWVKCVQLDLEAKGLLARGEAAAVSAHLAAEGGAGLAQERLARRLNPPARGAVLTDRDEGRPAGLAQAARWRVSVARRRRSGANWAAPPNLRGPMTGIRPTRRHLLAAAAALGAGPVLAQPARPRVRLQTDKGALVLELAADKAPVTVANYLRYVDARRFDGAAFFRAVNAPGAPTVGFIQAGIRNAAKLFPPIAHESTLVTGLKHADGAISMARLEPGTARADFTIICGDAPHMDANPQAPGDNAGYAVFGQVVEGMDVARSILAAPRGGPAPTPVMAGQMLDPPVRIITARRV